MCPTCKRLLAAVPALALAAGAVVLAAGAVASTADVPARPLPDRAEAAAPAPDGLSPVATTRDWQETAQGSIIVRRPR